MGAVEDIPEAGNQAAGIEVDQTAAGGIAVQVAAEGTAEGSPVHTERPAGKAAVGGSDRAGVADCNLAEGKAFRAAALGVVVVASDAFAGLEGIVGWAALFVQAYLAVVACHTVLQGCMD